MAWNGLKWSKIVKMVKNGGLDLKWARHTGLSARRAGRTKSRGPKGLQLEVGPGGAPKLLVFIYELCSIYLSELLMDSPLLGTFQSCQFCSALDPHPLPPLPSSSPSLSPQFCYPHLHLIWNNSGVQLPRWYWWGGCANQKGCRPTRRCLLIPLKLVLPWAFDWPLTSLSPAVTLQFKLIDILKTKWE